MMESLREIFFKTDRSTQKLTTGRTHYSMLDVRCSTFISFFLDLTGRFFGQRRRSYETTQSWNSEPQNVEGWNRSAQSFFYKIDRSTQKLTTGRSTQKLTTGRSTKGLTRARIHSFRTCPPPEDSTFIIRYTIHSRRPASALIFRIRSSPLCRLASTSCPTCFD
jgi:hypothetical protein